MSNPYGSPENPFRDDSHGSDREDAGTGGGSSLPSYGDYVTDGDGDTGDTATPYAGGLTGTGTPTYAGAGRRLGAYVIDGILIGIVAMVLYYIFAWDDVSTYSDQYTTWQDAGKPEGHAPTMDVTGLLITSLATLVIWFLYRILTEVRTGQSLGKKLLGIRVVDEEGKTLSARASFQRNSWYIVVFLLTTFVGNIGQIVSLILMAVLGVMISRSAFRQHTFDQWAKAYVVNAR